MTAWQYDLSKHMHWRIAQQMQNLLVNPDHLSIRLQRSARTHQLSEEISLFWMDISIFQWLRGYQISCKYGRGGNRDNSQMIVSNYNSWLAAIQIEGTIYRSGYASCNKSQPSKALSGLIFAWARKIVLFKTHICLSKKNHHIQHCKIFVAPFFITFVVMFFHSD